MQERDLVHDADSYENLVLSMRQTLARAEQPSQDLHRPEGCLPAQDPRRAEARGSPVVEAVP